MGLEVGLLEVPLMEKEALIGCFVCMSFAGSFIEVVGDGVALGLG